MTTIAKFVEFRNTVLELLETQHPELKGRGSVKVTSYIKRLLEELDRIDICVAVTDEALDATINLLKKNGIADVLAGFEVRDGEVQSTIVEDESFTSLKEACKESALHEVITLTRHLISILLSFISPEEANT